MSDSYNFGKQAEKLAQKFLIKKGYKILATNFFYQKAEIDIIAEIQNIICIVEVKALAYNTLKEPFEAVDIKKQSLLIKAADFYIQENNIDFEARFDVISIVKNNDKFQIEHIEDAFYIF